MLLEKNSQFLVDNITYNKSIFAGKRVLVHSIFYHPELTGISKYSGEMVDWMVENGIDCTVVTAFPFYPDWKIQQPYKNLFYKKEVNSEGTYTTYRCPLYVPANPSGLKRILHEFTFLVSSFPIFILFLFKKRFDLIVCVAPPFHLAFLAIFYRFFKKTKIVYHIQDLQIDMAREMNLIKSPKLLSFLENLELLLLAKVDVISSISDGMIAKIRDKVNRDLLTFPNWVDVTKFQPIFEKAHIKSLWGFAPTNKIILYSGSIGKKQGLEQILTLAESFKNNIDVKFIICGTGPYKETLMEMVREKDLFNVFFFPLQPNNLFNQFLNIADIHLILQKKNASDLVMPSKLTTILAVGGLVVATAPPNTSLNSVIITNNIGVVVDPENDELLIEKIAECLSNDYSSIKYNARKFAEKYISIDGIMSKFSREQLLEI